MFRRFFYGRNGADQLSLAVTILAVLLSFIPAVQIGTFILPLGTVLGMAALAYAIFRMLSKNVVKRRQENLKFTNILYKIKQWFKGIGARRADAKTHKVFRCPRCRQKLRVPRWKGKITITCSRCGNKFVKKT